MSRRARTVPKQARMENPSLTSAGGEDWGEAGRGGKQGMVAGPDEALEAWGVSPYFPCCLIRLPGRLVNSLALEDIHGVGELLDEWGAIGSKGMLAKPNVGAKSVRRLEVFIDALERMDHKAASEFLPLDASGAGVSLGRSLEMVAAEQKREDKLLLRRRLVERMSLEESAEGSGLTRERVRQIEEVFLEQVRARLEYFEEDASRMTAAWERGEEWSAHVQRGDCDEDAELVLGALDRMFGQSPEAVARSEREMAGIEAAFEEILAHPDLWHGGVRLAEFLKERVAAELRQRFCERVFKSLALRIDFIEGLVVPEKMNLRRTVTAMLAGRKQPLPLSQLMELIEQTGRHPGLSPLTLMNRRRNWSRDFGFPEHMILWEE